MRRTARLLMQFLPGTDFISSGYSAVPNYDNMFAGSNEDAEDFDDYNVIQRDLKVDGGLRPVREEDVIAIRNKAARALQAVFAGMGLPPITMKKWKPPPTPTVQKICLSAISSKTSSSPRRSSTRTATAWKW
jgi:propanediol dehydratase large subunit